MPTELAPTAAPLAPLLYPSLDRNPAAVYLASLAESSRRTMRRALDTVAMVVLGTDAFTFPWGDLRYAHTQAIRSKLAERYAPATANRHLAALRGVLKECRRLKLMSGDDYQDAVDLKRIRGERAKQGEKGRHLSQGEISALLATCTDGSPLGARDAAIIALGYSCGLRRAEIAGLLLEDYDADNGTLTIRRGKGNKERIVPLGATGALDALADWLHVRGDGPGPLFLAINRGRRIRSSALGDADIYGIIVKRAAAARVKAFSPHDLRRTFAGDLLDAGADLVTVQKLMGHADISTTAGYDRRDAKAKRAAVNKLHVPYRRQWED